MVQSNSYKEVATMMLDEINYLTNELLEDFAVFEELQEDVDTWHTNLMKRFSRNPPIDLDVVRCLEDIRSIMNKTEFLLAIARDTFGEIEDVTLLLDGLTK